MTQVKRKEHLEGIHNALIQAKWLQDKDGHFIKEDASHLPYRMKMQKTSLRYEQKVSGKWSLVVSDYFKNIEISDRQRFLIIKGKKIRL